MSAKKRARIDEPSPKSSPLHVVLQDHKMPAVLQKEFEDDCQKKGLQIRWRESATPDELRQTCAVFSYLHDPVKYAVVHCVPFLIKMCFRISQ